MFRSMKLPPNSGSAVVARPGREGVALISTLAILSLVAVLLVTFTSVVTSDRQATHSYGAGMAATEVARSGLDAIVSQLRAEIADAGNAARMQVVTNALVPASASYPVYRPLTVAGLGPERMSILPASSDLLDIVKVSKPGAKFYTTAAVSGTNYASSVLTTSNSPNGRSVSLARWNLPVLVPTSATNLFPVPSWIFLGRSGPTVPASGAMGNSKEILGRYAYVVYDVSGLLDVNVAGYPKAALDSAGHKGLLPWADLTQLTNAITQADVEALVAWRNAATASSYASHVTNGWATNGFTRVSPGDTAFVGRQDLLQFASQSSAKDWKAALPYLTTFSREINGPVWGPATNAPAGAPYDYVAHQYDGAPTTKTVANSYGNVTTPSTVYNNNVFILGPTVQTTYTNAFGIVRKAGEPLVKYRFPLDKLALLEATTNAATWTANKTEIQKYFGLDYVTTGIDPSTGLFRHWSYPTSNAAYGSGGGTTRILTLNEVAKLRRDPNFFELLQAGMLTGSLGKGGRGDYSGSFVTTPSTTDPDLNLGYQVMRIGANLADQWDADSCPTTITFDGNNFYGIEDLPYVSKVFFKSYSTLSASATSGAVTPLVYFELWNPHQDRSASSASRPTNFRLAPYGGDSYFPEISALITTPTSYTAYWQTSSQTTFGSSAVPNAGVMPFTAAAGDYREPSLIFSGTSASPSIPTGYVFNTNAVISPSAGSDRKIAVVGLKLPDVSLPATGAKSQSALAWPFWTTSPAPTVPQWQFLFQFQALYPLQYEWPPGSGTYHTYSTLAGVEMSSPDGTSRWGLATGSAATYPVSTPDANANAWVKSDPRTARWAASFSFYTTNTVSYKNPLMAGNSLLPKSGLLTDDYNQIYQKLPFNATSPTPPFANTAAYAYRADLWAANTNSVSYAGPNPYYQDMDQTQRLGDAAFSAASSHLPSYGGDGSRPVILNRPFTSVGDLGYVFRDMPWKTLNFFSGDSADAALLDLFSLEEGGITAGGFNPNAAPVPVLRALLAGANLDSTNSAPTIPNVPALASAIRDTATNSTTGGFFSRADLVAKFMGNGVVGGVSASNLKTQREAVVRALAESANTRTWNLMIDLVAQSGRFPETATSPDKFIVDGERRLWLHIAIDRYTGEIVDRRVEVVGE